MQAIDANVHSPFDPVIFHSLIKQGIKPVNCEWECCGRSYMFSFIAKLSLTSVNFVFLFVTWVIRSLHSVLQTRGGPGDGCLFTFMYIVFHIKDHRSLCRESQYSMKGKKGICCWPFKWGTTSDLKVNLCNYNYSLTITIIRFDTDMRMPKNNNTGRNGFYSSQNKNFFFF